MAPYGNEELERFFSEPLAERDPVLKTSIDNELCRQQSQIVLRCHGSDALPRMATDFRM